MELYLKMKMNGFGPLESVRNTFKAALVSPAFIFREEKKVKKNPGNEFSLIDEYALANRMSYFLWSSMPRSVVESGGTRKT